MYGRLQTLNIHYAYFSNMGTSRLYACISKYVFSNAHFSDKPEMIFAIFCIFCYIFIQVFYSSFSLGYLQWQETKNGKYHLWFVTKMCI
jgi:hypothetical protein